MFGYIQQLLQAFQARSQKRSSYLLRMEEISPYLAKIKSSAIYMPGQTQFSGQVSLYHICSIALYCTGCVVITVLCCEMWWCAVLKCAVLYMLCGNVFSYIVLHCIVIYCIVLYNILLYGRSYTRNVDSKIEPILFLSQVVTIDSIVSEVTILPTKTKPKKIVFIGSDSHRYVI